MLHKKIYIYNCKKDTIIEFRENSSDSRKCNSRFYGPFIRSCCLEKNPKLACHSKKNELSETYGIHRNVIRNIISLQFFDFVTMSTSSYLMLPCLCSNSMLLVENEAYPKQASDGLACLKVIFGDVRQKSILSRKVTLEFLNVAIRVGGARANFSVIPAQF